MPTLDQPWTEADYRECYRKKCEPFGYNPATRRAIYLHYHRWAKLHTVDIKWQGIAARLALTPADHIATVGAGFAWGAECAAKRGLAVCSCDNSAFINDRKSQSEEQEIRALFMAAGLDATSPEGQRLLTTLCDFQPRTRVQLEHEDMRDEASRRRFRQAFSVPSWTYVISEDVLPCLSDAGAVAFAQNLDRMNPTARVVHLAMPAMPWKPPGNQNPGLNWKTVPEWQALLDAAGLQHMVVDHLASGRWEYTREAVADLKTDGTRDG